MYKRLVSSYIKDELKKGKTIGQIRKKLLKAGHPEKDVDNVLRTYEFKEKDLKNKAQTLQTTKTKVNFTVAIIIIVIIINLAFFFYYASNPNYILVRQTSTGLVTEPITKQELQNLEQSLNLSDSEEGLSEIS